VNVVGPMWQVRDGERFGWARGWRMVEMDGWQKVQSRRRERTQGEDWDSSSTLGDFSASAGGGCDIAEDRPLRVRERQEVALACRESGESLVKPSHGCCGRELCCRQLASQFNFNCYRSVKGRQHP